VQNEADKPSGRNSHGDQGGIVALALAFTDAPEPNDETIEQEGLRVFIEQSLIEPLSERTLDVRSTEQGSELVFR